MKIRLGLVVVIAATIGAAQSTMADADSPATPAVAGTAAQATAPSDQPWVSAEAILKATGRDIDCGGVRAIESHVGDLEQALADGPRAIAPPAPGNGPTYVLADGPTETLAVLGVAGATGTKRRSIAVSNPYPLISLYLGSYYNEIGKSEDALRVLDAGLKLTELPELKLGQNLPYLYSERGAALQGLKRWQDALANYDDGLKLSDMKDKDSARLDRGRGFALTELSRLDEAEEAYKVSLKLDPDNPVALGELKYIAGLRAGKPATPSGLTLPNASKPQ